MLTFNAIDVETANADRASICQIGIVHVRDGAIHDRWQTLINPKDWFDPWNVSIHGITPDDVRNSPTLPEVRDELRRRLRGTVVASHTAFDRVAFERAMTRHNLEQLQVTWLDSAKIARRAWPDRDARKGWGLKNVAGDLGIAFKHHDALEDARAAAQVVLHACAASETDIEQWLTRLAEPITCPHPAPAARSEAPRANHSNGERRRRLAWRNDRVHGCAQHATTRSRRSGRGRRMQHRWQCHEESVHHRRGRARQERAERLREKPQTPPGGSADRQRNEDRDPLRGRLFRTRRHRGDALRTAARPKKTQAGEKRYLPNSHTVTSDRNRVTVHRLVMPFTAMSGPNPSARAAADPRTVRLALELLERTVGRSKPHRAGRWALAMQTKAKGE